MEWKAACLCCMGWFEVLCITLTVVVGFLYILKLCLLSSLVMVMSRKFMDLFSSVSRVNLSLGCILLMCVWSCSICLLLPLYMRSMSSTYLYQYNILCACLLFSVFSMCVCSMLCMNISASMLDMGEPIGRPSDWV